MKTLASVLLLLPLSAFCCSSDADCQAGAQCVKPYGQAQGMCKGGANPGLRSDPNPGYPQPNANAGSENACAADSDCGAAARCAKRRGQSTGVCVSRPSR